MRTRGCHWLTAWLAAASACWIGGCASNAAARAWRGVPTEVAFWSPAPDEPRIQFLRSFGLSSDVEPEPSMLDRIIWGRDVQVVPIGKPYGVAVWNDRIYVCDVTNPGVVILDLRKHETRIMVSRGVEPMAQPTDIAIAPDGLKYVADRRIHRIFVFDADDRHVRTFGDPKTLVPAGVAVHGDELYVPDLRSQSVLVLDRFDGRELRRIGEAGGSEGQFITPVGVDVDDRGDVYVTDAIRGRLQRFDAGGDLRMAVGQIGDTPGSFARPKHVAVDGDGVIYVVDGAFQNVQMFSGDGELLMYFGGPGTFPGAMNLPAGVAVIEGDLRPFADLVHPAFNPARLIVVTNQFGPDKVAVYAMGSLRPGHTVAELSPDGPQMPPPRQPAGDVIGGELLAPGPGVEAAPDEDDD